MVRWKIERETVRKVGAESRNDGAGYEIRTRDIKLGKLALYQLS